MGTGRKFPTLAWYRGGGSRLFLQHMVWFTCLSPLELLALHVPFWHASALCSCPTGFWAAKVGQWGAGELAALTLGSRLMNCGFFQLYGSIKQEVMGCIDSQETAQWISFPLSSTLLPANLKHYSDKNRLVLFLKGANECIYNHYNTHS